MAVIYRIRNNVTGKCYIGQTKNPNPHTRWREHVNNIKHGRGCPALRDAVKKYGIESFQFDILIFCFDEDRFRYEIEYIAKYNTQIPNGYNISKGGEGTAGFTGKKHSKEAVEKIKATLKKVVTSEEHRRKMSEKDTEMFRSPEARKKMSDVIKNSEAFKKAVQEGRIGGTSHDYTPEVRNKISKSLKEYFSSNEAHSVNIEKHRKAMAVAVGRKVYQYSLEGVFLKEYESIKSAARSVNIGSNAISLVLNSPTRISAGFRWKTSGPTEHVGAGSDLV